MGTFRLGQENVGAASPMARPRFTMWMLRPFVAGACRLRPEDVRAASSVARPRLTGTEAAALLTSDRCLLGPSQTFLSAGSSSTGKSSAACNVIGNIDSASRGLDSCEHTSSSQDSGKQGSCALNSGGQDSSAGASRQDSSAGASDAAVALQERNDPATSVLLLCAEDAVPSMSFSQLKVGDGFHCTSLFLQPLLH